MFGVKTIGWWGMTETISHGFIGLTDRPNAPMSMGRAAPEYEIRVLDDRGAPAGPGEVGDLAIRGVRGLSLFAEYLGNPAATAEAFDREGFLLTGDRVRSDESGFYFFADRAKDLLKVGGENVSAAEVERVILASPGVREVAVVGKPHPMLDEAPVAFIIPVDRDDVGLVERVATACRERLADFKRPHELRIVNELPRATLEKVAKSQLARAPLRRARERGRSQSRITEIARARHIPLASKCWTAIGGADLQGECTAQIDKWFKSLVPLVANGAWLAQAMSPLRLQNDKVWPVDILRCSFQILLPGAVQDRLARYVSTHYA